MRAALSRWFVVPGTRAIFAFAGRSRIAAAVCAVARSVGRPVAILAFALAMSWLAPEVSAGPGPWARLDLVENTTEGPAFDRCGIENTVDGDRATRWRVFYGEVREDPVASWIAIRARSGCAKITSEREPAPWILRGSPYLVVDVSLTGAAAPDRELRLEVALVIRKVSGFERGAPRYGERVEKRTLHLPTAGSATIPLLIAGPREVEEFRVRELLLRVRASDLSSSPEAEYGAIAVAADVARAGIFLDGSLVGRTSAESPVVLEGVRKGEREVVVADASGREVREVALVDKGRRADVSLTLLPKRVAPDAGGLRPLGQNGQGSDEFWREKDGAIVVRIPAGELQMGSGEAEGEAVERPRHTVRVPSFLMDKTEVTWGQYRRFATQTGRSVLKVPVWGMPEAFPASYVTWEDGRAFCAWVGGRLPTEAEWERAARGDGARVYPWGNEWDNSRCNTRDGGPHGPTAAASYPECVSPYGVLDLAGSMSEWCQDWYDPAYYSESPQENPRGPETGGTRVSRGGYWMSASSGVRSATRQGIDPTWPNPTRGFRCVEDDRGLVATAEDSAAGPETRPTRLGIRLETIANLESGPATPCEVVQGTRGGALPSWSTFGDAKPSERGGFELVSATTRCGTGAFSEPSPGLPSGVDAAPFLILEISATPRWDPVPMDPGPVPVVQTMVALSSRRLTAFTADGGPVYGEPTKEHRAARLGEGEEFAWPVAIVDGEGRRFPGVHEVVIRITAGREGRPGATEYGALAVMGAAPDSEIRVDGGLAARVGAGGSGLLPHVPVGLREVGLIGPAGAGIVRMVTVVTGRTVIVSPEPPERDAPPQALFVAVGTNAHGFFEFRRERDGAVMVKIPEGEFVMGNLDTEGKPEPHPVSVSVFLIDKLPVTWGLFKRFAAAAGRPLPPEPYWGIRDDHPVAFVRWDEGRAYCEWAGARLPTEAEREKAARGTDGRKFPWGNEDPTPERGVFRRNWGDVGTDTVGIRPAGASPYGLLDTGGNVWEWCDDWYDPDYYKSSPRQDPTGPRTGRARVVRGGSWDSRPTVLSASCRNFGYVGYREGDFGFRCAADVPY